MEENKKRVPWAIWTVKEEEFKLKLNTSVITKLESKYKINLLDTLSTGSIPPLGVMLDVTHGALQKFHHGIKLEKVYEMFDDYVEEGGSQITFMSDVYLPIFTASGFFSPAQAMEMDANLQEAKEQMI